MLIRLFQTCLMHIISTKRTIGETKLFPRLYNI
jgi:hypothetical protein